MALSKTFSTRNINSGPPPSSQTEFITAAPDAIQAFAANNGLASDNPQIQMRYKGRTLYAHDQGSHEDFRADKPWLYYPAGGTFNITEVIDGTDPENPSLVEPNEPDLYVLQERVLTSKWMHTPSAYNGAFSAAQIAENNNNRGRDLETAIPG